MKAYINFFISFLFITSTSAQITIENWSLGSIGGEKTFGSNSRTIYYSLGDIVGGTIDNSNIYLEQGFVHCDSCSTKTGMNNSFSFENDNLSIKVYPNPANSIIFFQGDARLLKNLKISLWTIEGKLVKKEVIQEAQLDISHIPSGLYYLTGTSRDSYKTSRTIIIKY